MCPSAVITNHPGGNRPLKLAAYLGKMVICKSAERNKYYLEI